METTQFTIRYDQKAYNIEKYLHAIIDYSDPVDIAL